MTCRSIYYTIDSYNNSELLACEEWVLDSNLHCKYNIFMFDTYRMIGYAEFLPGLRTNTVAKLIPRGIVKIHTKPQKTGRQNIISLSDDYIETYVDKSGRHYT